MHIAFLTPEFPHEATSKVGGLGTSIYNLVSALVLENVRVTVFCYSQLKDAIYDESGFQLQLIKKRDYPIGGWYLYRKYINSYVSKQINQNQIDIIEAPDWTGITAFMSFKIPLVIRFHGSDTYFCHLEKRKQKWKNHYLETKAFSTAQAFIAPTDFAGKLSKQLFKIKNKRIQTIHYGLDIKRFENTQPLNYNQGEILYLGTIIRKKGVFELPQIFNLVKQKFPNAKLKLIGSDSQDAKTQKSTWQILKEQFHPDDNSQVSYLGKIPYEEVEQHINSANVCIFPTYAETLGMVTIESMALKKAVVNSNIGWAQELMEDGKSGYLVHPQSHKEYSEKIVSLLNDQEKTLQFGKQARLFVETHFNIITQAQKNIDFYKALI